MHCFHESRKNEFDYNGLSPPLTDIVLSGFSLLSFPSKFLKWIFPFGFPLKIFLNAYGEKFPHPYKKCFVSLSNRFGISQSTCPVETRFPLQLMWNLLIHLLWGLASLLAHRPVSTPLRGSAFSLAHRPVAGSDTICNSPSISLANIVLFGLSFSDFKTLPHLLGRDFHILIKNASFLSPTDMGSYID